MSRHNAPDDSPRRIGQPALVCFVVSGTAFLACAMGLFVNHYLTGALAVSGTAAIGLLYLALGLMNLGNNGDRAGAETVQIRIRESQQEAREEVAAIAGLVEPVPLKEFAGEPAATVSLASSSRETALSGTDQRA